MARIVLFISFLFLSSDAFATQQHTDPEGLYSHLVAHIFFIAALVVLIIQIKRSAPAQQGWRFVGGAALLFLLWNIDTFAVHIVREFITPGMFTGAPDAWTRRMDLSLLRAKVFYAGKILDHVFLVGALGVFTLGIRAFARDARREED